jgi:hypothetical protein
LSRFAPEETERTPDIRHNSTCEAAPAICYTPLVTASNVPPGTEFGPHREGSSENQVEFVDATPDMSRVLVTSNATLTSMPGDKGGLYEWSEGRLQLVSILPEAEGGIPTRGVIGRVGRGDARHAISNDGSRIFWAANGETASLYMRDTLRGETLRIGIQPAFEGSSSDGSKVFFSKSFSSESALEVCDVMEVGGKLACHVTQLAPDLQGTMVASSEDGSYVYFVSNSALAAGAISGTCQKEPRSQPPSVQCNLYMVHDSGTLWEAPKLVAVLSGGDYADWFGDLDKLTARASPDGRRLAFMSQASLTGYDNRDVVSGKPDEELYLYDAETEKLVCASCNPTGARSTGAEFNSIREGILGGAVGWEGTTWLAASVHGWTPYRLAEALYQSRYLSDSGRLFFDTPEALVPQDVNGKWDVYELEPVEVGGCSASSATFSAGTGGCVGLISGGTSPEDSAFMEASANGDDVFFQTDSHLSPEDFDTAFDIYDAHVCSGAVPCYSPPVSPPPCSTGDGCKAAPSPQPAVFGAPASATFSGAGNVSVSPPKPHGSKTKSKPLTRTQKLARALKACRREPRKKRGACERRARRRFGAKQSRNDKLTTKGNR